MFKKEINFKHIAVITVLIIIISALTLVSFQMIKPELLNPEKIPVDLNENLGQLTPQGIDFPHTKGGTLSGWAGSKYYKEPIDEVVILFASVTVPGLTILYYPQENKLVAGTPQMTATGIELFQGERHNLVYSFDLGKTQKIYYDGELKAESDFQLYGSELTGMVTGAPTAIVSESFEVEIS
ncbi:MAG: hypothetical protein AABW48_05810 [Nanoarchaeota archaeon]